MRTLFLMAVLAILALIATKRPDQSAWDAAREVSAQIESVISEFQGPGREDTEVTGYEGDEPMTGNAKEDFARLQQRIRRSLDQDRPRANAPAQRETPVDVTDNKKPALPAAPNTSPPPSSSPGPESLTPPAGGTKNKPRSDVAEVPDLPPIPAAPTAPAEKAKVVTPPAKPTRAPAADEQDYVEVKKFYENASRLLAGIK